MIRSWLMRRRLRTSGSGSGGNRQIAIALVGRIGGRGDTALDRAADSVVQREHRSWMHWLSDAGEKEQGLLAHRGQRIGGRGRQQPVRSRRGDRESDAKSDGAAERDLDQRLDRGLHRAGVAVRYQEHDDRSNRGDPVARPPRDQGGERKQRRRK